MKVSIFLKQFLKINEFAQCLNFLSQGEKNSKFLFRNKIFVLPGLFCEKKYYESSPKNGFPKISENNNVAYLMAGGEKKLLLRISLPTSNFC